MDLSQLLYVDYNKSISGLASTSPSFKPEPLHSLPLYISACFQMFKGFDKAKDIQYVYTPVFSSLCGVKLDSNNKAGYLLSGRVMKRSSCTSEQEAAQHVIAFIYDVCDVVMSLNREYVERWEDLYWSVRPGRVLGQPITVTKEKSQLQIPDGL